MNFFDNKVTKLLVSGLLIAGTVCSSPLMSFAKNTYNPAQGGTVDFETYVIYDAQANSPKATFSFEIAPGTAIEAANGKEAVFAGNNAAVDGTPTIETASFTPSKDKYTSAQEVVTTIGKHANLTNDPVTLEATQAYSRDEVTVDFSNVRFYEPGVYRWKITEQSSEANTGMGIVYDTNPVRYLDVYVNHSGFTPDNSTEGAGSGTLAVIGYVLHSVADFQPSALVTETPLEPTSGQDSTKAIGYTHTYETHDLVLSKSVDGNQASIDKYFKFEVAIENAGDTTEFDVVGAHDATVPNDSNNSVTNSSYKGQTNPALITTSNGDATVSYYLQHGQNVKIQGLPKNAKVTITETPEDYTPTYSVDSGTAQSGDSYVISALTADTTVAFTNTKNGTIPTGVIVSVIPGILLVAGATIVAYSTFKKRQEGEA